MVKSRLTSIVSQPIKVVVDVVVVVYVVVVYPKYIPLKSSQNWVCNR